MFLKHYTSINVFALIHVQDIFLDKTEGNVIRVVENGQDFLLDKLVTVAQEEMIDVIYTMQTKTNFFNITGDLLMVGSLVRKLSECFEFFKC